MIWGPFLGIAFRAYIPMTISSYLNIMNQFNHESEYFGDILADFYSTFIMFLTNVFFPGAMLYTAWVPKEWLLDPDFKKKWGFLYESIKTENRMQRMHFFMFIFRRALLIWCGFFLFYYPSIQV